MIVLVLLSLRLVKIIAWSFAILEICHFTEVKWVVSVDLRLTVVKEIIKQNKKKHVFVYANKRSTKTAFSLSFLKGIIQQKIQMCWKCVHPQVIQDVDEFVSSSGLEKCSIASVSQQWMLCSEWVPSEWESDKHITIIHTTPVHQFT